MKKASCRTKRKPLLGLRTPRSPKGQERTDHGRKFVGNYRFPARQYVLHGEKSPFTYTVKGGELFTDRRGRSVTRSTFEKAFEKIRSDAAVTGPKKLNMYGAPYVFAVLKAIGAVPPRGAAPEKE